jgi:hypothetical protein
MGVVGFAFLVLWVGFGWTIRVGKVFSEEIEMAIGIWIWLKCLESAFFSAEKSALISLSTSGSETSEIGWDCWNSRIGSRIGTTD